MQKLKIDDIRGVIWDLDNTLYRFDDAFIHACHLAAARAALSIGVDLSFEDALLMAKDSFSRFGWSGALFERDYKISFEAYHFHFHAALEEKIIQANAEMQTAMKEFFVPHVILTNASRGWAARILTHLGLKEYFPDDNIIPQEDAGFQSKTQGSRGFEIALEKLGLPPGNVVIADDLSHNLRIPKDMGIQTVLIHHGQAPEEIPAYVDACFSDTVSFMRILIAGHYQQLQGSPARQVSS